jgi:putative oxidoreductase
VADAPSIMKAIPHIARVLLGFIFTVFGLNGFLHFIPMPPPTGVAGQFMGALAGSHYLAVVFALQLVGGVLLLANRFVPLALTLLGPVIVNIVLFHIFMAPAGMAMAMVVSLLWLVVFWSVRTAFAFIFQPRVTSDIPAHRSTGVENARAAAAVR